METWRRQGDILVVGIEDDLAVALELPGGLTPPALKVTRGSNDCIVEASIVMGIDNGIRSSIGDWN